MFRAEFDKKVDDIQKLARVLKASKNIDFAPPGEICLTLTKLLCFGKFLLPSTDKTVKWRKKTPDNSATVDNDHEDIIRVARLCKHVISANLLSNDVEKSFAFVLVDPANHLVFTKLMSRILDAMSNQLSNIKHLQESDYAHVIEMVMCLYHINGGEDRKQYAVQRPIETSYSKLRVLSVDVCSLFPELREMMMLIVHPLLNLVDPEDYREISKYRYLPSVRKITNALFKMGTFLIDADDNVREKRLTYFAREVMTVPFLTMYLPSETLQEFSSDGTIMRILALTTAPSMDLPPSKHPVFTSGHFLLGNIAGIAPSVFIDSNVEIGSSIDHLVEKYTNTCSYLLHKFYVPGVFQGVGGVIYTREGAVLIASGVPLALRDQILCLLDREFLNSLYQRYFTLNFLRTRSPRHEEDSEDVRTALSQTGLEIARESMNTSMEDAQSWGISSWFAKLNNSITNAFTFRSKKSESGNNDKKSSSKDIAHDEKAKHYHKVLLQRLKPTLDGIIGLWALMIPQVASTSSHDSIGWKSLTFLVFSTPLVQKLWSFSSLHNLESLSESFDAASHLQLGHPSMNFILIAALLKIMLIALDDTELYDQGKPVELVEFLPFIRLYKTILYKSLVTDVDILKEPKLATSSNPMESKMFEEEIVMRLYRYHGMKVICSVLDNLHTRWARRPFSSAKLWIIDEADSSRVLRELRDRTPFSLLLLRTMPWSISFYQRMKFFREIVDKEKISIQGVNEETGIRSRGHTITVRRNRLLEDGKEAMEKIGNTIKERIMVKYVNEFGQDESGIDAGGLFKDFWTDLSHRVFDVNFGLFIETSNKMTYPNPSATSLYDHYEIDNLYTFLGRILGKALFENIVVQPQFAHFFLAFMHGRYNFMNLINDLATLDKELYKNLMFLKTYDDDISALDLTFSVTDDSFGKKLRSKYDWFLPIPDISNRINFSFPLQGAQQEVDLIPNGQNITVTSKNKHRYVQCVAKYYLHDRIQKQAAAFFHGLYGVIQPELLGMFCAPELQILISGAVTGISVEELRQNCCYTGGYHAMDTRVQWFWQAFKGASHFLSYHE